MATGVSLGTLSSVTTGTGFNIPKGAVDHAWQVIPTDCASLVVVLEGSLDGISFVTIDTYNGTSGTIRFKASSPALTVRMNVTTITGAGAKCQVLWFGR